MQRLAFRRRPALSDTHRLLKGPAAVLVARLAAARLAADRAPRSLAADADGDDTIDVRDAIALLNWLYAGGPKPRCLSDEERRVPCEANESSRPIAG